NPLDERGFARYRRQLVGAVGLGRFLPGLSRPVAECLHVLSTLLERGRLRVGQRRALIPHPLEWCLGFVAPVALEVGLAVRRARRDPGFGARRLCRRLRTGRRKRNRRETQRQSECAGERKRSMSRGYGRGHRDGLLHWLQILVGLGPTNKKRAPAGLAIECLVLSAAPSRARRWCENGAASHICSPIRQPSPIAYRDLALTLAAASSCARYDSSSMRARSRCRSSMPLNSRCCVESRNISAASCCRSRDAWINAARRSMYSICWSAGVASVH